VRATTINGRWEIALPDHRADRPQWGRPGGWERERLDAMREVISEGTVVVDVGAEEGDLSGLYATWGARLALVEPNPRVWPNIRAVWEANGLEPPLLCVVGFAADRDDPALDGEMAPPWPRCAYGEVVGDHGFLNLWERPDVARHRVDSLARVLPPIEVLTIDVEGAELRVLRGAEGVLRDRRPTVFVSVHPGFMRDGYGDRPADLGAYMTWLGYEGWHLATDHEQHWRFTPR
jgi:FkbM family methyltransferase